MLAKQAACCVRASVGCVFPAMTAIRLPQSNGSSVPNAGKMFHHKKRTDARAVGQCVATPTSTWPGQVGHAAVLKSWYSTSGSNDEEEPPCLQCGSSIVYEDDSGGVDRWVCAECDNEWPREDVTAGTSTGGAAGDSAEADTVAIINPTDSMGATFATGDAAIVVNDLNVEAGKLRDGGGGATGKSGSQKSSVLKKGTKLRKVTVITNDSVVNNECIKARLKPSEGGFTYMFKPEWLRKV